MKILSNFLLLIKILNISTDVIFIVNELIVIPPSELLELGTSDLAEVVTDVSAELATMKVSRHRIRTKLKTTNFGILEFNEEFDDKRNHFKVSDIQNFMAFCYFCFDF